ncbi:MAG: hybrid sensor histidine kinase/response regulator [Candidatus Magnetoovum sp. WYHC-5]|nr:hybrid sensor histidine kinase/response regulator [Candidatus Magnetoovum sp. WYHC-5]
MNDENKIINTARTVLIVEDSLTQRELLKRFMLEKGFNVILAKDGYEAINVIKDNRANVIISDIAMPEMDGYDFCRKIKTNEHTKNIPIILLTELSGPECIVNGLDCGADNFMFKPYDKEELLSMVESLLYISSSQLRHTEPTSLMEVQLGGKKYNINFEKRQMLNLLISTFENAAKQNRELIKIQLQLREKTNQLEKLNKLLETQIQEEIAKRIEKEKLLIQQSKVASLGEMIGTIAHQWRQPLNSLGLLIQDLEDAYQFNELTFSYIKEVVKESMAYINYMSKTIDDFRNFFKYGNKKLFFDAKLAIKEIVNMIASELRKNNIKYKYFCKHQNELIDIDNSTDDFTIYGSSNELMQAILNIVLNAKDSIIENRQKTTPQEKYGLITIYISNDNDKITITITDNGGGIPTELLDKIFEPYFTTKTEKGTGIGLYMTKQIIEYSMNGKIFAKNTEDGAVFTIELPTSKK